MYVLALQKKLLQGLISYCLFTKGFSYKELKMVEYLKKKGYEISSTDPEVA